MADQNPEKDIQFEGVMGPTGSRPRYRRRVKRPHHPLNPESTKPIEELERELEELHREMGKKKPSPPAGGSSYPGPSDPSARKCPVCGAFFTHKDKRFRRCDSCYWDNRRRSGKVSVSSLPKPESLTVPGTYASPKHVKPEFMVEEYPSHDKCASDGVDTPSVRIDYRPHPKQEIFSQAIEKGAKIVFFLAGIRSGKTHAVCYETVKQLYKYDATPNLGYIVAPTNMMTRTPRRIFELVAGDARVTTKRASDAGPAHFLMRPTLSSQGNYFVIELHTGEHADRMRGPTIAFAIFDEAQLMKSEVYDVVRGRVMESGGVILGALTPAYPGHWTKTEILDRAYRCGRCGVCVYDHYDLALGEDGAPEKDSSGLETRRYVPKDHEPENMTGDPRIAVITCSTFDNTYLERAQVDQLKQDYALKDQVIVRRELFAEYAGFEGLVYSGFDRAKNGSEFTPATLPPEAYVCAGLDFGVNDPFVCVFLARIGSTWHVISEYYSTAQGRTLKDHVAAIRTAAGPIYPRVKNWWHDPSGRIVARELARYGLNSMKSARKRQSTGQRWLNYRIEVVSSHIAAVDEKEKPLFRISPRCPMTLRDFESRKWKRYVAKGEDGIARIIDLKGHEVDRNAGDEPAPGNDHGTDAVEYALVSEFVRGLYTVKGPKRVDLEPVEEVDSSLSPEELSLGRHLSQSLDEKRRRLLSTKPARRGSIGQVHPSWAM